ncbi:MAG: DUF5107 domain-containing protein [Terrimicrobiaceae bacterium]|nr:DUF5107 domain-containing protein [Terrimicrobiaceae bacterium]
MSAPVPSDAVRVWSEDRIIPTYEPAPPDRNPMFIEKRVYQGSSGKVYPLPFYDRISETPTDHSWRAVWIENVFLRVMVLPQIGGRIHIAQGKTNGYDFIYQQHVIKPALVGLAGPWASGGIEFNWPQHHRPATFMPADVEIESHADGSKTIWCGDHDPTARMKGMHGICLHPGPVFNRGKSARDRRSASMCARIWRSARRRSRAARRVRPSRCSGRRWPCRGPWGRPGISFPIKATFITTSARPATRSATGFPQGSGGCRRRISKVIFRT